MVAAKESTKCQWNNTPGCTIIVGHPRGTCNAAKATQTTNQRFHRDPRVIAARKQYRVDLKAGMPEKEAWSRQQQVNVAVLNEIKRT
jgi:hypothetical protein